MKRPKHLAVCLGLTLLLIALVAPAAAQASFGINSLSVTARNQDGSVDLQAGSHPYEYTLKFNTNQDEEGRPEGRIRDLFVDLPPGLVGNPQSLPRCRRQDFLGVASGCPGNTQVGVANIFVKNLGVLTNVGVHNLTPSPGVPVTLGLTIDNNNSFQEALVRTGGDYGATVRDITLPTEVGIQSVEETIWGVPMDRAHDPHRLCANPIDPGGPLIEGCSSDSLPAPFLTLPTSCLGPLKTTLRVDSLGEPGEFVEESTRSVEDGGQLAGLTGCDRPAFDPKVTVQPETSASDSPTGLHVNLHIPQNADPAGIATANLKDTRITLPAGMAVNPSAADGLAACSSQQIDLHGSGPANCPAASKVGTVSVETPLLDHPLPGSVYLAKQGDNPFNSLLALYIAVNDPITGVVVKLAGKVEPDPVTGQLRTTFKENPQLPFEDLNVDVFGGPRASLTTPPTCGKYTTTTDLIPWTSPEGPDVFPSDSFNVSGPCPGSESQMPNKPSFEAGTATPLAAGYSPFLFKVARENGSQRLRSIDATMPPGLVGKLAGLEQCTDAQIAAAAARKNPGEGAIEKQSPSCPSTSQIGTVTAGAGSGNPFYVQGNVYLAGPYKGSPVSLAFITPAVAGPFDLGTIVVRAALDIDSVTAQISVKSDPIPTILEGIPLDLRSVAVNADRDQFTLNPTSCDPMSIAASATSVLGQAANLSNRFQVGGCKGLDFEPQITTRLFGPTKRGGHPKLKATYTAKQGEANSARIAVTLPRSEFLDQAHIRTVCTRVQFAADACPAGAVYGHIKATTPLLSYPLEGPVYLRSSSHKLPDLLAVLKGPASQPIEVDLDGRIDSVHGGIRNTFEAVPDAPVSKVILTMQGGKKGLLVNSRDICAQTFRSKVRMEGHNGKTFDSNPAMRNGKC